MIYEMLTGARPFQGDNAQAILYSILTQPPRPVGELRADVRPEMGRLLDSVLQKERTARPDSIVEHLQRLQAGGGIPESDRRQARVPVIAVLPFTNMSADPDQEYFCDGMAEEILNALMHVEGLRVVARTSRAASRISARSGESWKRDTSWRGAFAGPERGCGSRLS